jgi:hypothetical protein
VRGRWSRWATAVSVRGVGAAPGASQPLRGGGARRRRARGGGRPALRRARGCACRLGVELEGRHALPGVREPWGATLPGDAAETGSDARGESGPASE